MSQSGTEGNQSGPSGFGSCPECKLSWMCKDTGTERDVFVQISVLQIFHVECRTVIGPSASLMCQEEIKKQAFSSFIG